MTRRDFNLIAKAIREAPSDDEAQRRLFAESLGDLLALSNARFDRGRFVTAATEEAGR